MLARVLLTGVAALVSTKVVALANPFGPLTLRYTRAVVPGGQVLCEWSSWIFLPKDYVEIVLIKDDSGFDQAENKLVATSELNAQSAGDFHLTRNDGRFELPIPIGIQSNQRYRVAIGESNKIPFGRPAKLLLSRSFFIGRQPSSLEQERHRGGSIVGSNHNPINVNSKPQLSITEPSSSLYIASEPVPVRWQNEGSRGTVLIKVLKQTDPGAWTEVGFFRMANVGAVDLELTPGACRGTFTIEVLPENNPQGFARSPVFDFDTDSNSYFSPDRACAVEPHMLRRESGSDSRNVDDEDEASTSSGIQRWFEEWTSNIASWHPTTLEVVYLVAGCLAFLTIVIALSCCCCPCCDRRRKQRDLMGASELNANPFGIEGPRPQYYVTQQSLSGPCQQNALPQQHTAPHHDRHKGSLTRSESLPSLIEQNQAHPIQSEPEPSPGVEPSAPPYSVVTRRSFTFSDRGGFNAGDRHTVFV